MDLTVTAKLWSTEQGVWIAQCLEYDLATQGASRDEAFGRFVTMLMGQMRFNETRKKPIMHNIPVAPQNYRDEAERLSRPGNDTMSSLPMKFGSQSLTLLLAGTAH